eukprot:TRINITY_DN1608_c0_g3_i1.p1 TRINITY_DN1608_c0_g3~~TRINITY_DN1608_c0_g3_i1.p1  ORF type:complete len:804 (+),score=160.90 TRINITY_DN1608_c0_g3_i1:89-2500(+)
MLSGTGATAAISAAAAGAFGYNRANYLYDSGLRFGRYMAGYGYAQGQAAQYREDIRDLTALATGKQDTYHTLGVIFFVLNFQLIMAGRLGVHGPSPPGWLLGIYWTNVVPALMFLVTAVWLTMHASARATAGSVHMLTRTVRIPIPSPKQLDKARKTGNSYEKQRMTDIFRVPFVVPAPKETIPEDAPADDAKKGATRTKATGSSRRMPKWFQDEQKELHAGKGGPAPLKGSTPEHFELYRGLQQEWAVHDCYARIGLLYWMSNWLTSISLMSQCHVFTELRMIWPAWTVTATFCTAHWCVLKCDLVEESHSRLLASIPLENIVPFTPLVTVLGMSLDYSTISPNDGWIAVIYILSWICYITHFAWALRLYELAMPHPQAEQPEIPGQFWYPAEWWLPRAFANSIYIVAAPKHLEPGQSCLQLEMKAAKGSKGSTAPQKKQRETGPMLFPWRVFRGALITNIALWSLIIFGRVFEQVHGERQILKQEGRVMRWPSHMQPWMAPWTRHHSRNEWAHTGGADRRLSAVRRGEKVTAMARRLAATLEDLAKALEVHSDSKLPKLLRADVAWPSELKPALLAAKSEDLVAALTREGHGAFLTLPQQAEQQLAAKIHTNFVLQGIDGLGELLGVSWGKSGLLVTSTGGHIAECAGQPVSGVWACKKIGASLPNGGSSIKAATAVRMPGTGLLRAAVTFAEEDGVVLMEADHDGKTWTPSGEVQLPQIAQGIDHHFSFSSAGDELMISSRNGGAMKWNVGETEPSLVATPQGAGKVWHAACNYGHGLVAHLASPSTSGAMPELLLSSRV